MNAFDVSGPSLTARAFYLHGHYTPPKVKPEPSPLNPPKPLDFDAVKAYRATHTMAETCAHFNCSQRHLYRKYYDAVKLDEPKPLDRMEVHAYRMSGKSIEDCARHFHIGWKALYALLDGLPKLPKPVKRPKESRVPAPKIGARYAMHITPAQLEYVKQMGGAKWLRALIDERMAGKGAKA